VRVVRFTARFNPALQAIPAFGQLGVLALGGWLAVAALGLGVFALLALLRIALDGDVTEV
jgi:ATP-binding cassette, subfamily B, bacterial